MDIENEQAVLVEYVTGFRRELIASDYPNDEKLYLLESYRMISQDELYSVLEAKMTLECRST